MRPPARAAAAPHSQPGRTRRPPAPAAAADWPRGGGSRPASRPHALACFQTRRARRLEFRAGPEGSARAASRAGCAP